MVVLPGFCFSQDLFLAGFVSRKIYFSQIDADFVRCHMLSYGAIALSFVFFLDLF